MSLATTLESRAEGAPLGLNSKSASPLEIIGENSRGVKNLDSSDFGEDLPVAGVCQAALDEERARRAAISRRYCWWLASRQRAVVIDNKLYKHFKSLVTCHRYAVPKYVKSKDGSVTFTGSPGEVQIHHYKKEDKIGLAWARRCGNAMLCFLDAPKIHYIRQQEVKECCIGMYELGHRWIFVTFTGSHDKNTDPVEFVELFQEVVRQFFSGKGFQKFKKKWGYVTTIRANECTDDNPDSKKKSGIHFHSHCIMFFKRDNDFSESEKEELSKEIIERWVNCLISKGLCPEEKREDLLKYSCKIEIKDTTNYENVKVDAEKAAGYAGKQAGMELAPGIFSKRNQLPDRISHWDLMALAFTSRPELIPRALTVMQALKGRAWIYFGSAKTMVGLKNLSDEEILKEEVGESVLYSFNEDDYLDIDDKKMQCEIIQASDFLHKNGLEYKMSVWISIDAFQSGYDPMSYARAFLDNKSSDFDTSNIARIDRSVPPSGT